MVTISLCMIVKDEAAVLARCLDSVKDVVDEIVIVDTGSCDHTKIIAELYTDKVFDFVWVDNFAAARNYSFSRAEMDYCMWMDADDILPQKDAEKLLEWKEKVTITEYESSALKTEVAPDVVMMKYVTGFDENGKSTFVYQRERLLKREKGFLWRGRVHEAIVPEGNIFCLDACVEHHSSKVKYSDRNLKIYERMKEEGVSFNPRDVFYYARELYYHQKYGEAVDNFEKFLNMKGAFVENQVEACRIAAYSCYGMGEETKALSFLLRGLQYRIPSGELCCDIGQHFMDRGNWEQAIFWYRSALRVPRKEQSGGFIQEECYGYLPCVQLSVCYDRIGEIRRALDYHCMAGRCKPYGKEFLANKEYFSQREREFGENVDEQIYVECIS